MHDPLPTELVRKIIEAVPPTAGNRDTFIQCCLVSWAAYTAARQKLWHTVNISMFKLHSGRRLEDFISMLRTPHPSETLPPLMSFIRRLAINIDNFAWDNAVARHVGHLVDPLASFLNELVRISVQNTDQGKPGINTLKIYGFRTYDYWDYIPLPLQDALYAVSQLPTLRTLELIRVESVPLSFLIGIPGARQRLVSKMSSVSLDSTYRPPFSNPFSFPSEKQDALACLGVQAQLVPSRSHEPCQTTIRYQTLADLGPFGPYTLKSRNAYKIESTQSSETIF